MKSWAIFKTSSLRDILFWILFLAAWCFLRVADFPSLSVAFTVTLVKVIILLLLVYFTNHLLIPKLLYRKKYWLFAIAFLSSIITLGFFKIYLIIQLIQPYYRPQLFLFDRLQVKIYDDLLPLFLLVSTGAGVKLVIGYLQSEKRIADITREKAETELQFLKSQVNPHFVFNTLNSIYFQIDKSNTEARETLLQFSDLLRYQLYECNVDKIPVEKELTYLSDYVKLQQKRKDNNYKVDWTTEGELSGFSIAPLLLMPLVENAFKHISHFADKTNTITIKAASKNGSFHFAISNTIEAGVAKTELTYGGIGLKNVKRRLELLYPGKHRLETKQQNDFYFVYLILHLHEN